MFPRRSHHLSPLTSLTSLTSKGNFSWNCEHQIAFKVMKALISHDCIMLRHPNHNKPFNVYTNASNYQLGTVIMQEGIPVIYYSHKLTDTQKKCMTLEK
jgi:hypothetical protein